LTTLSLKRLLGRATADAEPMPPVHDRFKSAAVGAGAALRPAGFDHVLLGVVVALMVTGLVMVYSASIALPDSPKFANYAPTHFLERHLLSIAVGTVAALITTRIPVAFWEKHAGKVFLLALVLLVLVLLPFIGKVVNNARRWIPLGVMNFQPSEFAKLAIAIYAAGYMVRKMDTRERFFRAVAPMGAAVLVTGLLLLRQPDMGAFIVIATIAMAVLFLGGVNARMFFLIAGLALAALALVLAFDDLRRGRILAYLDPWDPAHAQGKAYQLTHSLIAFGRGGLLGQGLGASVEKLHYLPEAHTDFLLAVIGEELGLVGVLGVVGAFFWLTRRIVAIGRQAIALDRVFAGLLAQGIGVWFGVQAFINIGVNLGALPTKGLTLPLMSFGGSAILMNLIALAVVLRIDVETRALMRGAPGERGLRGGRGLASGHVEGRAAP
jgi:cell division protein FtsW